MYLCKNYLLKSIGMVSGVTFGQNDLIDFYKTCEYKKSEKKLYLNRE